MFSASFEEMKVATSQPPFPSVPHSGLVFRWDTPRGPAALPAQAPCGAARRLEWGGSPHKALGLCDSPEECTLGQRARDNLWNH